MAYLSSATFFSYGDRSSSLIYVYTLYVAASSNRRENPFFFLSFPVYEMKVLGKTTVRFHLLEA